MRLLEWLVQNGTSEASRYEDQVARLQVVSECTCGGPTIDFGLDGRITSPSGGSLIISDCRGLSPEGVDVGVILNVRGDAIATLEVHSADGTDVFGLPKPEALTCF